MKPYRLISSFELNQLTSDFLLLLEDWNQQYSLNPITLKLSLAPKSYIPRQTIFIENEVNQSLACIHKEFIHMVNYALFAEDDLDFNASSKELFLKLLKSLFKNDSCSFTNKNKENLSWFYPGSPCLLLEFICQSYQSTLLLNPEWLTSILPANNRVKSSLHSLEEALAEKQVSLQLELSAMKIPIKQLMDLHIGDVLISDHQLTSSLRLTHEKQEFATAELGKTSDYKSIQLKEFA